MRPITCHECGADISRAHNHADICRGRRRPEYLTPEPTPEPMTKHPDMAGLVAELRQPVETYNLISLDRLLRRAAVALEALSTPQAQVMVDAQALHRVWAETLRDPEVTPSQLIIEFGRRCAALTQPATGKDDGSMMR